jgi:hypothetical protein
MAKIEKTSPHRGIDFDDFLKEQGVFEEVMSSPKVKKAIRDLEDSIQASSGFVDFRFSSPRVLQGTFGSPIKLNRTG